MTTSGVLANRRIVVTRAEDDAKQLAARLSQLGATPVVLPLIRIRWLDPGPLDQALSRLNSYDWVIFTSRNGVEAFFRRAPGISGPRVAAVGPATAAALRARGVDPDLVPDEHVAEGVIAGLGNVNGKRILLPRAAMGRKSLADDLRRAGAVVDDIPTYETIDTGGPWPDLSGVDAITFTSGSTVRAFVKGATIPGSAKVVCIGPQTAATAQELGIRVDVVAREYSEEGLIEAVVTALHR